MTCKEAINIIDIAIAEVEWNYPMDYAIAFEKAREALEKRIPEKVHDRKVNQLFGDILGRCPNCQAKANDLIKYCSRCGQKLDWSDE